MNAGTKEAVMERKHAKYQTLIERCKALPPVPCAVAHPCDESSLRGAVEAAQMGLPPGEAMDLLNEHDIPCGPILSMKEIAEEPSLRATGTVVEVDHPTRGKYLTVGNPIKLSDSATDVTRSPLLGEHTEEVLAQLGYSADDVAQMRAERVI